MKSFAIVAGAILSIPFALLLIAIIPFLIGPLLLVWGIQTDEERKWTFQPREMSSQGD